MAARRIASLTVHGAATYLERRDFILNPNASNSAAIADPKAGEIGTPHWRGNLGAFYRRGPFSFNTTVRYVGHAVSNVQASSESAAALEAAERFYTDVQGRYQVGDKVRLYAGVNNAFDVTPPRNPFTFSGTGRLDSPGQIGAGIYDVSGRFYYLGTSIHFSDPPNLRRIRQTSGAADA